LIWRREDLVELENILLFNLIGFQGSKAFCLESPLDPHLVVRIPQFGEIDGQLSVIRIEVTARNQISDMVGVPFLRQLVVEGLNPQRECVIDTDNCLAGKEHLWIVAQELRLVNGSGSSALIENPEEG